MFSSLATALLAFVLTSTNAKAAIEEIDSATVGATAGELGCAPPGRFPLTARLPAVAGEITEIKLSGSDLAAADYQFGVSRCSGECSLISATGSGSRMVVKARLGGVSSSVVLEARKKTGQRELTTVRFDVVEKATVTSVAPLDGVLIGTSVEINGSGLNALELGTGAACFDVTSKTANKITLRSKCEQNQPAGTGAQQTISLALSGALAGACRVRMSGLDTIRFAASQNAPIDLTGDFGPFSSFTRVDAVTPDRRVADSFCSGGTPITIEETSDCFTRGNPSSDSAQGIGGQTIASQQR